MYGQESGEAAAVLAIFRSLQLKTTDVENELEEESSSATPTVVPVEKGSSSLVKHDPGRGPF